MFQLLHSEVPSFPYLSQQFRSACYDHVLDCFGKLALQVVVNHSHHDRAQTIVNVSHYGLAR
jgi:hypothetical protein